MTTAQPHARATDIPDWPCPPHVNDIHTTPGSWGWVRINENGALGQDDDGYLWVDTQTVPRSQPEPSPIPCACLCWTEQGLGLYLTPGALQYIPVVPDPTLRLIPVAVVLRDLPVHIDTDN